MRTTTAIAVVPLKRNEMATPMSRRDDIRFDDPIVLHLVACVSSKPDCTDREQPHGETLGLGLGERLAAIHMPEATLE